MNLVYLVNWHRNSGTVIHKPASGTAGNMAGTSDAVQSGGIVVNQDAIDAALGRSADGRSSILPYREGTLTELLDSPFLTYGEKSRLAFAAGLTNGYETTRDQLKQGYLNQLKADNKEAARKADQAFIDEGGIIVTGNPKRQSSTPEVFRQTPRESISASQVLSWKQDFVRDYKAKVTDANRPEYQRKLAEYDAGIKQIEMWDDRANAQINREFGGFLAIGVLGGASLAAAPLVAGWASTTYGGGSAAYYGVTAGFGGASGYSLGYARDKTFGLERTWGTVAADVGGGAIFSSVFTPARIATISSKFGSSGAYIFAGSTSGGGSNLLGQGTDIYGGKQQTIDWWEVGSSSVVGGGAGWLGGKVEIRIPGWSSGSGNFASTFQGVNTRIFNGSATRYSILTGLRGAWGEGVRDSGARVIDKGVEGGVESARKRVSK